MVVPELPPMEESKPGDGDSVISYHKYLFYIWLLIVLAILVPLLFVYGARRNLELIWVPALNMCITYSALFVTVRAWRRDDKRRIYLGFAVMVASLAVSVSVYSMLA